MGVGSSDQRCAVVVATILTTPFTMPGPGRAGQPAVGAATPAIVGDWARGAEVFRDVTLAEVLRRATKSAPAIAVADAERSYADVAAAEASVLLPDDGLAYVALGARQTGTGRGFEWQASLQQPIAIAGERRVRKRVAQRERQRRGRVVDSTRRDVEQQVRVAYWRARIERERVDVAVHFERSAQRMLDIARERHRTGDGSQLDVDLAEADRAQAKEGRIAAQSRFRAACRTLAAIAGWSGPDVPAPAEPLPAPRRAGDAQRLAQHAVRTHPRIAALQAEATAADARLELARRETAPTPSLGMQWAQEPNPGSPTQTIGLATLSIPLPIWRRQRPEKAQARADARVARARQRSASVVMDQQVRRAATLVDAARERLEVYQTEVTPQLETNLAATERAFELGELGLPAISLARRRFLEVELRMLDAWGDYLVARAVLDTLVGQMGGAP